MVHEHATREKARAGLVDDWDAKRQADPGKSQLLFTHTNAEVRELNGEARERMAAQALDLPRWEAGQRMMQSASPTAFRAIVAADQIVTANREAIEGCEKAASKARETVRCTVRIAPIL